MIKHKILTECFSKSIFSIQVVKAEDIILSVISMGFRNPSTQDQYIGFNVGSAILLGSAPIT
jgi:hypothetical protein